MAKEEVIEYSAWARVITGMDGVVMVLLGFWIILGTLLFFNKLDADAFERLFLSVTVIVPLINALTNKS